MKSFERVSFAFYSLLSYIVCAYIMLGFYALMMHLDSNNLLKLVSCCSCISILLSLRITAFACSSVSIGVA